MKITVRVSLFAILLLSTSNAAYAYLDPVSVSFLIQGIIGAVAAVLASIRSIREKISKFFSSHFGSKEKEKGSDEQ